MFFNVRHAERADRAVQKSEIKIKIDPPITEVGILQATRTGKKIAETIIKQLGHQVNQIIIYSSPYLRCLMTSAYIRKELVKEFPEITSDIIANNMICETMKLYDDTDSNPLDCIYLNNENHDEVDSFMAGEPYTTDMRAEMGSPKFPEQKKKDEFLRINDGFQKIFEKHFKSIANGIVVISVSHAFSLVEFAKKYKFLNYDGERKISCISALRVQSPTETEMILCSDTTHVDDLLEGYHSHLKQKEERKAKVAQEEPFEEHKQQQI